MSTLNLPALEVATRVTVETTLLAILEFLDEDQEQTFTTRDIAGAMRVEEYPVRAAFSWLRRAGKIAIVEDAVCDRVTRTAGERYPVAVYKLKRAAETTPDFLAYYGRVCGGA